MIVFLLMQVNVLIDNKLTAQLADFGLVVVGDVTLGRMTTNHDSGTTRYMAPERFSTDEEPSRQTPAADIYAFGCLCYTASGHLIYSSMRVLTIIPKDIYRKAAL
jgi:serine/threonine protein kinase